MTPIFGRTPVTALLFVGDRFRIVVDESLLKMLAVKLSGFRFAGR